MTRILIVDDNPAVRRYLRAILEQQESWKVCGEARTGAEALHQVVAEGPDLILLDYQMPDLADLRDVSANSDPDADAASLKATC